MVYGKYTILMAALGWLGLAGCRGSIDLDDEGNIGSSSQALGVEDNCPVGKSYDFSYGNAKLLFCSDKDIFATDSNVNRAIVAIRGSGWQTCGYDCYYEKTRAEAVKAGLDLDKIDIIAPRFLRESTCDEGVCSLYGGACVSDPDCQPAGYHRWNQYYVGGNEDATGNGVTSYEILDALLFQIAAKRPNLENIVVAGQSQGGIFVSHYAPSSVVTSGGGINIRYWSANSGIYPWLDDSRPNPVAAAQCTGGANNWAYGLDNLFAYHTNKNVDASDVTINTFNRDIYWTSGGNDHADSEPTWYCTQAQGADSIARFRNYEQNAYQKCVNLGYQHCDSLKNDQFREIPGIAHGMTDSWKHPIGHKILFDTVHANCSESAVDYQDFSSGDLKIVGCAGTVSYANRNSLCAPGFAACGAAQWVNFRNNVAPDYSYWTNDALKYGGSSGSCWVDESSGSSCPSSSPMRVCMDKDLPGQPAGTDPLGNTCNWDHCGYDGSPQNEYFGGCYGNITAGTLCCPAAQ